MKVFMWIVIGVIGMLLAFFGILVGLFLTSIDKVTEDYLGDSEGEW